MLVNTIAFYPRPLRVVEPATLINGNAFGAHILRHTLFLAPTAVANAQLFGSPQLAVTRRYLQPAVVANAQVFGDNQVQLRSRTYLGQTTVSNTNAFGAHRFKKKLVHTAVSNVSSFGAHTIAAAEKKFSYSNTLGSGNRTGSITVTLGGVTIGGGTASQLVNGSAANEFWWNGGSSATLTFDLGTAKVIKQARWKQSNSSTHGTFKWQGSNDGTSYTDIGGTFTLGGTTVQIHTTLINNGTAYRYYRLTQTAGNTSNSPFLQEVEFYIEGTTKDLPDGSYRYPCGGGSDVGGDVSGVGGSGVDRSSLITVTAGYTVASAGQNAQNWIDGAVGNNTTDSVDFASGQSAITIKFDFQGSGKKQRIVGLSISQSNGTGQGTYTFEASNDNSNWTALATGIAWLTDINANGTNFTFSNTTAYRYYRLRQTGGSTASSPWIQEIFFKCAPSPYAADAL
jgi:hypothetical protein